MTYRMRMHLLACPPLVAPTTKMVRRNSKNRLVSKMVLAAREKKGRRPHDLCRLGASYSHQKKWRTLRILSIGLSVPNQPSECTSREAVCNKTTKTHKRMWMTMKNATLSTIQMRTVLRRKSQSDRPPEAQTIRTKQQPRLPFIPILLYAHPVLSEQRTDA